MKRLSLQNKPWLIALAIVLGGIALDAGSKVWARHTLLNDRFFERQSDYDTCSAYVVMVRRANFVSRNSHKAVVIPRIFQFRYVENCGSSFQLLDNIKQGIRYPFLVLIGFGALLAVPLLFLRTPSHQRFTLYALPLLLSGATGNLIDRVHYGYVVDFIDWFVVFGGNEYHWPTFNIADALILTGVGLMLWQLYRGDVSSKTEENTQ